MTVMTFKVDVSTKEEQGALLRPLIGTMIRSAIEEEAWATSARLAVA